MIVRIKRRENPFVQIDKRPLEDARLSWRAKGILAYLLTKPDGWRIQTEDILKHGTEGRDAVRVAMNELAEAGHAKLENTRNGREWVVYESPLMSSENSKPSPENPSMPCPEKANVGKSATSNKETRERDNEQKRDGELALAAEASRPGAENAGTFLAAWNALPSCFPKIRSMSPGRARALAARLKDPFWRDNWREALDRMTRSLFLSGKEPGKTWVADVEFFLRPDSAAKILEGKYDTKTTDAKAAEIPFWKGKI